MWNHTFYWNSLSPKGGGQPTGKLLAMIQSDFGDFAKFKEELAKAAVTQFGSGWAWVVVEGGKLKVEQTPNAETPLTSSRARSRSSRSTSGSTPTTSTTATAARTT